MYISRKIAERKPATIKRKNSRHPQSSVPDIRGEVVLNRIRRSINALFREGYLSPLPVAIGGRASNGA
jgi:hypothetical protein